MNNPPDTNANPADQCACKGQGRLLVTRHCLSLFAYALGCIERRRQRLALLELDDRLLADIGRRRSEAVAEAARPFWQFAMHYSARAEASDDQID